MSKARLQKHERSALEALKRLADGLTVTFEPGAKHRKAQVCHPSGVCVTVPLACSPTSEEFAQNGLRQLVRRAFLAKGIVL